MVDAKFLLTLVGLTAAVVALCKMDLRQPTVEGWNGVQLGRKMMPYAKFPNGQETAVGGNFMNPNMMGSGKFVQVPNYQAILSPRMNGGVDFGANIRYSMPAYENQAVPCDPLAMGDMAKENYTKENYPTSCGKGGLSNYDMAVAGGNVMSPNYSVGNYSQVEGSLKEAAPNVVTSELPIGTMTTMDALGNVEQPVMYNRMVYAPRLKSRLSGRGDPIRGDLAITPCQSGWFSVYPTLNVDLQEGAMNVLGGVNTDLMKLLAKSTSGTVDTFGGVNLADSGMNMSPQVTSELKSALSDVELTAFP